MKLQYRQKPRELTGRDVVVADVIVYEDTPPSLCVLRQNCGIHLLVTIYDDLKLDAKQLRWLACMLDEINLRPLIEDPG